MSESLTGTFSIVPSLVAMFFLTAKSSRIPLDLFLLIILNI